MKYHKIIKEMLRDEKDQEIISWIRSSLISDALILEKITLSEYFDLMEIKAERRSVERYEFK